MSTSVSLHKLVTYIRGVTFKPTNVEEKGSPETVVVMRTKNIQIKLDETDLIAVNRKFVRRKEQYLLEGDILISSANSWELVGKSCYVTKLDYSATAGGFISIVRTNTEFLDSRYFYHWITSGKIKHKIRHCGRQTTNISNLDRGRFLDLKIPLPPLPEQKRIAAILDKADAIRRKRQQAIDLADQYLRSVFLDMFGDPVTNPKGWELKSIESIASKEKYGIKAGPFGSSLKKQDYVNYGYKIYGQEQVIKDDFSYGDYFIDEEKYEKLKSCSISEGDLLISLVGTFGKIAVVPEKFKAGIINPRLMKVTFDRNKAEPMYMKYLLSTPGAMAKISHRSHGGTMGIVNVGIMKELELPIPPIKLQKSFLIIQETIFQFKQNSNKFNEKPLFNALSQQAFAGKL